MVVSFSKNLSLGHYPCESCSLDQVLLLRQCLGDLWLPERASMEQILHNRNPARKGHDIILERQREGGGDFNLSSFLFLWIFRNNSQLAHRETQWHCHVIVRDLYGYRGYLLAFWDQGLEMGLTTQDARRWTSRLGRFKYVMPATQVWQEFLWRHNHVRMHIHISILPIYILYPANQNWTVWT